MRDIKFRMWDKINKTIIKDIHDSEEFWLVINNNLYDVMQYTGLKDKNGKEIYEGDILLAPDWFGNLKCVCIYQQENQVSSIQGFGLYSYDRYFQKYRTLVESDEWDEFEVIGNIYDNPDLLEKGAEDE